MLGWRSQLVRPCLGIRIVTLISWDFGPGPKLFSLHYSRD